MNRLVREHYPVSKLPEDLRHGFEGQREVRVVIDAETSGEQTPDLDTASTHMPEAQLGHFSRFKHLRRANFASDEEADAYLRSLRDEWSHRER
jgi:hypothetical protein